MFRGPVKLIDVLERDAEGKPTGAIKGKPNYDVMIDAETYAAQVDEAGANYLAAYKVEPQYLDDCWAGLGNYDPRTTTVYLRFTTLAEAEAKLARWLAPVEA